MTAPHFLPLSTAQRGVWSAQQIFPTSPVYRVGQVIWLDGEIDPARFVAAIDAAVLETEALRVEFDDTDGSPVQAVREGRKVDTQVEPDVLTDAEIVERARVDYRSEVSGADLYEPASLLARRSEGGWAWAFTHHHLVLDAYGVSLFVRRVSEHYTAAVAPVPVAEKWFGNLSEVVEGPQSSQTADAERDARAYWQDLVSEAEGRQVSEVPLDEAFSFRPALASVPLPDDIRDQLNGWARAARLFWPDVLVGLWGMYVARTQHQDHLAVRMPFMLRDGAAALRTPSMASRIFPVVVGLRPDDSLTQVLRTISTQVRAVPKQDAIEDAQIARLWPGGEADFFALPVINLKLLDYSADFAGVAGLEETVNAGPVAPLDLSVYNDPVHGFLIDVRGRSATVAGLSLQEHATAFGQFMRSALAQSAQVTLAELDRLLPRANVALPQGIQPEVEVSTVDEMVRARALTSADRVAVLDDQSGTAWTFGEFDARVNALAALLIEQGVETGDRVGVLLPRSPELVLAMAAILRAGAAYLPIDPRLPRERIDMIVEDGIPRVVLTDQLRSDLTSAKSVHLDDLSVVDALDRGRTTAPTMSRPLLTNDPVYVIFTSGTTGRPKGVEVPHRALVNRLVWGRECYPLPDGTSVLMKTPVSFDVSAPEVFASLAEGARLVVAADGMHGDPVYLHDVIQRHRITRTNFVPSMAQEFLAAAPGPYTWPHVTMVAGEAFPSDLGAALSELTGGTVLNVYGPTETGEITHHEYSPADSSGVVPIGKPMAHTLVRVLDPWLGQVPPGTPGELYLGGAQLASGYVGRTRLTAERFVADPAGSHGERLYRTGDLVLINTDGVLEYLGRADDQIKVRGHRVEPSEVASVLELHPHIDRAVVVPFVHEVAGTQLSAYFTSAEADSADLVEEARSHLVARLPDYMVPSSIQRIAHVPLTTNGKIDRRELPEPHLTNARTTGALPQTDDEIVLAASMRKVLSLPTETPIGVDDDFFRLGGHSLLATRLVARINAACGVRATLRDVFDHPTVSGLADLVDGLRDAAPDESDQALSSVRPEQIPASSGQRSLWFAEQLGGPGGRYVIPTVARLSGPLNVAALDYAVRDVVERHEPLRTRLRSVGDSLVQDIASVDAVGDAVSVAVEDYREVGQAAIDRRIGEIIGAGFDLAEDLPLRAVLLREDEEHARLVLAIHHHALDEWSLPALLSDLSLAYDARVAGREPSWQPLAVQYADHTLRQAALLGDPQQHTSPLARHLVYWREALQGAPEESTITLDRARPAEPTHRGFDIPFALDSEVVQGLHRVSEQLGATPFMVMSAATALAVSALGGGDDVVVGSPVGGRTAEGVADAVGYFANVLPIRHQLSGADTLAEVVLRSRERVLDAFAHQEAPFDQILSALGVERDASRNPIYQVMLTHQQHTGEAFPLALSGVEVQPSEVGIGAVKADLDIYVTDSPQALSGFVSAAHDLFDQETVERLVDVLLRILTEIAAAPGRRLATVDVCPAEQAKTLARWSAGEATTDEASTADDLLRAQANSSPDRIALIDHPTGARWSYADLAREQNAVARVLVDLGVKVGDRVCVVLPRGPELVFTLAGIWRAGAAYVPVDPTHPTDYVLDVVARSSASAVVSDRATAAGHVLRESTSNLVLIDDLVRDRAAGQSVLVEAPVLDRPLHRDDPAFAIFTSGTTGRAKGVQVSHGALVNRLRWGSKLLGLDDAGVCLTKSGVGFVDAATEVFGPLVAGATTVVVDDETARDPSALGAVVREHAVSHLLTVPSLAEILSEISAEDSLTSLRSWSSSGEPLPAGTLNAMRTAAPGAQIFNFYGSTEVTGDATVGSLPSAEAAVREVAIGRPQPGVSTWILDPWLRPVPIGVVGELYVGGAQLADGYLGQPQLSAERFVADPFSQVGGRLFRTGDLACWNPLGEIDFHGRADDQVKIRGHRVEPEHVSQIVRDHPLVSGAYVAAHDTGGMTQLVAYFTTVQDADDLNESVREHCAARLPDYLVPAQFVSLETFPLTPNGKIDRRGLPLPDPDLSSAGPLPQTGTEASVAAVMGSVLGIEQDHPLGLQDHFFRRGGDSLLAARMVTQLNTALTASLRIRDVFTHPTVGGLAALLEAPAVGAQAPAPLPSIRDVVRPDPVPASLGQEALWVLDEMGDGAAYQVALALRVEGGADPRCLSEAVTQLATRHEILRTVFVPDDHGNLTQDIRPVQEAPTLRVEAVQTEVVAERVNDLRSHRLNLATEGGVAFTLLQTGADDYLVVHGHHIVIDEGSIAPLVRDLNVLYTAGLEGVPANLPGTCAQSAEFALWQREVVGERTDPNARCLADLAYWKSTLRGLPTETLLPLDRPRSRTSTRTIRTVESTVGQGDSRSVRDALAEHGATPLQAVTAALAASLWWEGAGTAIPIGTPVDLRDQPELADAIGYLVNTVVVRADLEPDAGFAEVVGGVRERVLTAAEHKLTPFDRVVEAVNPPRLPGVSPLFQVMTAALNGGHDAAQGPLVPDASVLGDPIESAQRAALFDLVCAIAADEDGALTLRFNAARELFDDTTIQRLISQTGQFLVLGLRYPELPLRHLGHLVRAHAQVRSNSLPQPGTRHRLPVAGFRPEEAPLWRAAVDYLRASLPEADSLELDHHEDQAFLAGRLQSRELHSHLVDLASELVQSYASHTPLVMESSATSRHPRLRPADRMRLSSSELAQIRAAYGDDCRLLPLSSLQSGLFYHMVRAEESGERHAYVSQALREFSGVVDPERLRTITGQVVDRYPNLRAVFVALGDTEVQVIPAQSQVPFTVFSLEEWRSQDTQLDDFLAQERANPFEPHRPPMLRFTLVQHQEDAWTLAMTFEHILMDGWSINALLNEIIDTYADPSLLTASTPASYEDYLDWLERQDADVAFRDWHGYLADVTEPTILWPEGGDLSGGAHTGDVARDLSAADANAVFAAAQHAGVTVGTLLQTAWAITLARMTGRSTVTFGNTVSGRPADLVDADRMIGLLFNTVPMCVTLSPGESAEGLLHRVQTEQLQVIDHPYVELSALQRLVGIGTLFDTLFVVQNLPLGPMTDASRPDGLQVTGGSINDSTHYPVTFAVNPWEESGRASVHVRLSYRTDALADSAAERLVERYAHVLASLVADLRQPIGRLPAAIPDDAALEQQGHRQEIPWITVGDLLVEAVARSPHATALVAGERELTFAEFSARVHQYARVLMDSGVGPEHRVALLLPRDERMIIAMFAVFAVGAAYVPIDGELPDERISTMVGIARPTATLVTDRDAERLAGRATGHILNLDEADVQTRIHHADSGPITDEERGVPVHPDHLAYIIFTSGSTGTPKGVAVGYRGLTNMYVNHVAEIFDRVVAEQGGRRMKIAHTTSFSFDASWEQLFWLLHGHEVHVIDEEMRREPERLLEHYDQRRIDGFDVTPSYGQVLVDQGLLERPRPLGDSVDADAPGVVFVSLGGEAVPDALWRALREAPGVEAYNLYGPTEYTINALGADLSDSESSSVGRPILNTHAYILDDNLQRVLPGVPGELYLAGSGTARGYWAQAGRTAAQFVACPWQPGERMYRTGDRARWKPDGTIDYLGRADDQVKIRGYRIEPGEVSDTLTTDPTVARATVIARPDAQGALQLYGYVVPAQGQPADLDLDSVRARARTILPDYMIPAGLAALADLPLSVNGKIDARSLPEIEISQAEYAAPTTDAETAVTSVVADLLGIGEVSTHANFFDIGGNSLLAMRLVARLNDRLNSSLLVKDVFASQVLSDLAALADREDGAPADLLDAVTLPLARSTNGRHLFCAHARYGHAALYADLVNYVPDGLGVVGLQDPAHAGLRTEFDTIEDLAATYADAIQQVQPSGPYDLLGWSFGGHIMFAVGRVLHERGETVGSLTIIDTTPSARGLYEAGQVVPRPGVPVADDDLRQREFLAVYAQELREVLGEDASREVFADRDQLASFAISGLRCERLMAPDTVGSLSAAALVVAAGGPPVDTDEGAGAWRRHLPQAEVVRVEDEDHHSIVRPERGIPRWAHHLMRLLDQGNPTNVLKETN
ncbi:non-ribosomal peptide synthetase [Demetria terragena]|uniref:non-ribosomal peptide synthetase n=1 Tax=Demetria terragena TaxID=63959 RepID=UPI00035F1188|nr:non-ribosomal peptide synthetase [Demetria terragena]